MNQPAATSNASPPPLPAIHALYTDARNAYILTDEGEMKTLPLDQAATYLHKQPVMVCHAPYMRSKLKMDEFYAFDVLELFAFVHPAHFCIPTPHGLCQALELETPSSLDEMPFALLDIARTLLTSLRSDPYKAKAEPLAIAALMGLNGKGWAWTPFIFSALSQIYSPEAPINGKAAISVWKNLPEWADEAPPPPPSHFGVSPEEAQERLKQLLGQAAEKREAQMDFSSHIAESFQPAQDIDDPHLIMAEAGTGVGKTLGYLAPASVWAEKNKGTVWVSTYTKNLQRQIDQELDKLYPEPTVKDAHVAIRKGRENYLCLLNLEESAAGAALAKHYTTTIAIGLMARWTAATNDGDLTGAQFPGWLSGLLGYAHTRGLSDRRGECIYSACDHYKNCFVERAVRKSKHARIVIANHALVMINAALADAEEDMPSHYIFDEAHHLFSAADSAFAAHLTAQETRDFRRWLLGAEGGRRSGRANGLKRRAQDLCEGMSEAEDALQNIVTAAQCLTTDGWTRRFKEAAPSGPAEKFLYDVYAQVMARESNQASMGYSIETHTHPVNEAILQSAKDFKIALLVLQKPMQALSKILHKKLTDDDGHLDSDTRKRLDTLSTSIERRASHTLQSWIEMLDNLLKPQHSPELIDWMEIERIDGRSVDIGLYRHYTDPMKPFAASIRPHLQGLAVTSATMRDSAQENETWESAEQRSGLKYLPGSPKHKYYSSPFDYKNQTKVLIINDVNKNDMMQLAAAYRALFIASGGAALGLFTAISRLKNVYESIASSLESNNIPLYAQHIDNIDTGTLVDMFRDNIPSCLLGTDAIRDGVDVPGEALRLIAFDRVPWPRPTILHKARREAFGGRQYDEMLTRLKLKQAFGRLIRRADDKGVFVMLDSALPSRLHDAFPQDVEIQKVGLNEAIDQIKSFF
ncbi:MAG: helicase [Micavibrio sp.]|nr:helicase [Micavibrio sp.]